MNYRHAIAAVLAAAAMISSVFAVDDEFSTIRFSNNDQLTGTLNELSPERLVWKSSVLEKPTPFLLDHVVDVTLPGGLPETTAGHEASVSLTNGDLLRGQIASVSDEMVELDTWFAGRMKLNRLMITDIKIADLPDFLYRGPSGMAGWVQSADPPAWSYQGAGFRSNGTGSIARDVHLPDECTVAFDVAWRGSLSLKLVLFSKELETESPDSGYEITFQPRVMQLRNCKTKRFIGLSRNGAILQEVEQARIEIRASLKSGKICMFINGEIVEIWTDPDVTREDAGTGIHFIAMNSAPVQISRIEAGKWDGEIDKMPDPQMIGGMPPIGLPGGQDEDEEESSVTKSETVPDTGRMELRNGDSMTGEVVAVNDGMITVKTPFREVRLPIERLRSLALKPVSLERCKRYNGDVRAWFSDGSTVVFRLDAAAQNSVTGYSQNFGTAEFQTGAFSRMEFNIYNEELEKLRMTSGW